MRKTVTSHIVVLFIAATSAGCAGVQPSSSSPKSRAGDVNDPLVELTLVANEALQERRLLGRTRDTLAQQGITAEQIERRRVQAQYIPSGFETRAAFHFEGDGEQAARAIALMAGYKFKTLADGNFGRRPAGGIYVRIALKDVMLIEALHQLSAAVGNAAVIEVDEDARSFEYRYKAPTGKAGS